MSPLVLLVLLAIGYFKSGFNSYPSVVYVNQTLSIGENDVVSLFVFVGLTLFV